MPKSRILGVEIFEPYVDRFGLEEIYDRVIVGNVREETFDLSPDVVIFGDVLEHMDRFDALSVLKKFFVNSTVCVVSIPIIHFPQGESDGNIYETHLHQWNFSTFQDDMAECGIPTCGIGQAVESGAARASKNNENSWLWELKPSF